MDSLNEDCVQFQSISTIDLEVENAQPPPVPPEVTNDSACAATHTDVEERVSVDQVPATSSQDQPSSSRTETQPQNTSSSQQSQSTQGYSRSQANNPSRREVQNLISEPPPPYPGPPLNAPSIMQPNHLPPSYGIIEHPSSITSPAATILTSQSQQPAIFIPFARVPGGYISLPGQVAYPLDSGCGSHEDRRGNFAQSVPAMTTRGTVIMRPPTHQTQTAREQVRRQPAQAYLGLSFFMLVCCAFQGNLPALCCVFPALCFSMKAQQYNEHRNYRKANSNGKAALLCNSLALMEYILLVISISVAIASVLILGVLY